MAAAIIRYAPALAPSVALVPADTSNALEDPDPSIRVRALDLIFQLVSRNNARALVAELLNYLVVAPSEQKRDTCSNILQVERGAMRCMDMDRSLRRVSV